jgi:hypothetical protein
MPEVRLLVPITDNDGKPHAPGEVVDVDVETAEAWRAAGKVSLVTAEQAAEEAAAEGHYTDVTGREDVAPLSAGASPPGPQAEPGDDDEDEPKAKPKGKK